MTISSPSALIAIGLADRGKIDRKSLRLYKFNLRFVHDKYSQLEMDILFELYRMPPNQGMPWVGFNLILLKRLLESEFIGVREIQAGTIVGGIKATPDLIFMTKKGRGFIKELGIHEL